MHNLEIPDLQLYIDGISNISNNDKCDKLSTVGTSVTISAGERYQTTSEGYLYSGFGNNETGYIYIAIFDKNWKAMGNLLVHKKAGDVGNGTGTTNYVYLKKGFILEATATNTKEAQFFPIE